MYHGTHTGPDRAGQRFGENPRRYVADHFIGDMPGDLVLGWNAASRARNEQMVESRVAANVTSDRGPSAAFHFANSGYIAADCWAAESRELTAMKMRVEGTIDLMDEL
jgi:hypothetical protein